MPATEVPTKPYEGQKPGTSGLRKKVKVFQQENYLANFVQATFNALKKTDGIPSVLVVGGDGRFYGKDACQIIVKIAAANGVKRIWIGQNGLLSTPAVSAIVRNREGGFVAKGAFILTASHNPGGPDEDFGIKYNGANGGPAPEKLTNIIFEETTTVSTLLVDNSIPEIDLAKTQVQTFGETTVEVIDSVEDHVNLLSKVFNFDNIKALINRKDFNFVYDAMHGVAGPYAQRIFVDLLGASPSSLLNAEPKEDFGRGHPDPNLTYAVELVKAMGLQRDGSKLPGVDAANVPQFGAAADGDADRNMILGRQFFVSPSDSVAIIAANCQCIPFFAGGLKAIARSMPTSEAADSVAKKLGIPIFEVPTGWKFFGNLMDSKEVYGQEDYNPLICGEESFGTGSNHVREKDGMWAVLAWLSIIASKNVDASKPLVTVEDIVVNHWKEFGRNFYSRYDYEGVETDAANKLMERMRNMKASEVANLGEAKCTTVDDFSFTDSVDKSVSQKQGLRVMFSDGSRFVFRLSGTGSSGATIRLYLEQRVAAEQVVSAVAAGTLPSTADALKDLIALALKTSDLEALTGRKEPTVIT